MKQNNSIRPEDILADGIDSTIIGGMNIRKGTIAAFLANINLLENPETTASQKENAIKMLQQLAPAVIVTGLYKHATFKNDQVQQILYNADQELR